MNARWTLRRLTVHAAFAGLAAASISSIPGIVYVVATGERWWRPVQQIATAVGVHQTQHFALSTLLVGGMLHLALSLVYAMAFALMVRRVAQRWLIPLGASYGLLIFLVNFALFEQLGWFDAVRSGTSAAVELSAHLVFGLVVGGALSLSCRHEASDTRWNRLSRPPLR